MRNAPRMKIDILTLFPGMFKSGPFEESIIKKAKDAGKIIIKVHNLRDWSRDKHKKVDDKPYGGGPGMVMSPQPIFDAVNSLLKGKATSNRSSGARRVQKKRKSSTRVVLLTPQGTRFDQDQAKRLLHYKHLILICGHYEGVDERVKEALVADEISIGDYVLTCGELPAMVLVDAIVRLVPGVLGHPDSKKEESFSPRHLLEYPQYTRPRIFRGLEVPAVLLSGDHKRIEIWRKAQALKKTAKRRPDLMRKYEG